MQSNDSEEIQSGDSEEMQASDSEEMPSPRLPGVPHPQGSPGIVGCLSKRRAVPAGRAGAQRQETSVAPSTRA